MKLVTRANLRFLLHHPWQIVLSVLGIAIAVAVVVGIDLANASARRAFDLSVEEVAGRATHEILGGSRGIDETVYARLRTETGWRDAAPVVEGWVRSEALPGRSLRLLGVDPFAEGRFRSFTASFASSEGTLDLGRFLTEPGAVLLARSLGDDLGIAPGDTFDVEIAGRRDSLLLIGWLPQDDETRQADLDLIVADLATAQETLGTVGRLDRIDLILPTAESGEPGGAHPVESWLPPGLELRSKDSRSGALDQMTRAFRLNLQALSLLALLVGMFLIYNTLTFQVVQRRTLIGTLRALGTTRREILRTVLFEALLLGLIGSLFGLLLGWLLSSTLLDLMIGTINDLYFELAVRDIDLPIGGFAKGLLLGIGGTLLAALQPAREATQAPPRAVLQRSGLERRIREALPKLALAGLGLLLLSAGLLALPSRDLILSFAAIFVFVLGFACLVPVLTAFAMAALRPLAVRIFGLLGGMAARGVATTLSRTGVAMAALVIAVAMTIGVGIMVRSFRATLVDWLEVTLQADLYVTAAGARGPVHDLDPAVVERLRELPGVDHVNTLRRLAVSTSVGRAQLTTFDMSREAFDSFRWTRGSADEIWKAFRDGALLASEAFAYHHDLALGDPVEITTERGPENFTLAGIYYDYASDRGLLTLHRSIYDRFWDDRGVQSVSLYAAKGTDLEALEADIAQTAGSQQEIVVSPNRELRRTALEIFDRTFLITSVLRLLALGVAFLGILGSLLALQMERGRELGVLRANGLTPGQVWGLVTTQTGLMGLVAGLLSIPLGLALAMLLIEIINRRSFGWTMAFQPSPEVWAQAVLLSCLASLLAGLYPAWRMSRASPAAALREE